MISNEVYKEMKGLKGEKSFSVLIKELLNEKNSKIGFGLYECLGTLKKDEEWKNIEKDLKKPEAFFKNAYI